MCIVPFKGPKAALHGKQTNKQTNKRANNKIQNESNKGLNPIERRSPSLSGGAPWDLISEKVCIEVNGERKIIVRSRLNCATNYTYDVCQFKR